MRRDVQGGATAKPSPNAGNDRRALPLPARQPAGELPPPPGSARALLAARSQGWLWYLIGCTLAAALFFAIQPADSGSGLLLGNVLYDGLGLAAAAAVVFGAHRHRASSPLAWCLIAAGLCLSTGADVVYDLLRGSQDRVPFPSLADLIYITSYMFYAAGLLLLIRSRYPEGRVHGRLLDGLILAAALGLLAWAFLVEPYASRPELTIIAKLASMVLPLMDVLLLAVAVRLADVEGDGVGPYPISLVLIALALIAAFFADVAYGLTALAGLYRVGAVTDLGFLVAYSCWGAAALHPSMKVLSEPQRSRQVRLTRPRIGLLLAVSLVAPTLLAVQALRGRTFPSVVLLVGVAVLFVLVLLRFAALAGAEVARADAQERLLDRVVQATEEERARVAADLHDGPIQRLAGVSYTAELARRRLARGQVASSRHLLEALERQISGEVDALRRLMATLRPPVLDDWGLEAALKQVAADLRRATGIACVVDAPAMQRLDPSRETVLYRVAQEALQNVARHSGARNVWISLSVKDQVARLAVHDDGVGFDVDGAGRLDNRHFGLVGMRQRVEMAGGTLSVRSRIQQGTVISASLPLADQGTRPRGGA